MIFNCTQFQEDRPTGLEVNLRRPEGLKSDENAILSETYLKSAMRGAYAPQPGCSMGPI